MDQGPAHLEEAVPSDLAERYRRALGLDAMAMHPDLPIQVVSTGLPYLIVPVRPAGLSIARIENSDFEALLAESGAKFVYVLDPAAPEGRTWDNAGRVEDIATGSAAVRRSRTSSITASIPGTRRSHRPGSLHGRPSMIEVIRQPIDGHYWVGGPVAAVATGHFQAQLAD